MTTTEPIESEAPPEMNPAVGRRPNRGGPDGPLRFVWDSVLMGWRWLVRMRTALYLLAILAVETLIATVVPQEPNVPTTVDDWLTGEEGPGATVSAVLDAFGLFDVYGSTLFLATLLLLYLSLTACMIPRVRAWVRLVRRSVPPRSRYPDRAEVVAQVTTDRSPDEVLDRARGVLEDGRWRVRPGTDDGAGPPQIAAEKGLWSREGGSLLFHLSFYVLLGAVVYGQLAGFTGQVGAVEGEPGFSDTISQYWMRDPGRWWGDGDHAGWTLDLDEFEVDWVRDPLAPGAGQPTTFASDVTVTGADGDVTTARIEGNAPVTFGGMKVTQLDWGYAPRFEVEVDGEVVWDDFAIARADGTDLPHFRTAVKAASADPDVGLDVFLFPFAPDGEERPQVTGAPWADAPLVVMNAYRGDLQLGRTQQSIWQLDTSALERIDRASLRPGTEVVLDDGVVVRFVELRRWVGFQVSNRPQLPWLLLASGMLLAGLWPALYAYRRRAWIAVTPAADRARTLVTVGGRAFQRPQTFEDEHDQLVRDLLTAVGGEPIVRPPAARGAQPVPTAAALDPTVAADPATAPDPGAEP